MAIITGTSNFVSFSAAVRYYSDKQTVNEKIADGSIAIGKPSIALQEGARLVTNVEGRYMIESPEPDRYHIVGRRWFSKTYGNTYHTCTIDKNGRQLFECPIEYGYGDSYIQTALDKLVAEGHLIKPADNANGSNDLYSWQYRAEHHITVDVIDVPRKKDL